MRQVIAVVRLHGGEITLWTQKWILFFYDTTPAYEGEDCEIILNGDEIVVSYDDEDGVTVYRGKDDGQGHFVLECREKQGKATLYRMNGSKFLEGFWIEEGYKGFWRIVLP